MKVSLKQVVYLFGIIGVMMLASNVFAQTPEDPSSGREAMREKKKAQMLEIFKQLNLTPEQEKQLQAHRSKHREQLAAVRKSIRAKKEDFRNELHNKELNMEVINRIHSELKNLRSKKADKRLESILGVRKILNAEQFAKFCELKKGMRPMKKWRDGPH